MMNEAVVMIVLDVTGVVKLMSGTSRWNVREGLYLRGKRIVTIMPSPSPFHTRGMKFAGNLRGDLPPDL